MVENDPCSRRVRRLYVEDHLAEHGPVPVGGLPRPRAAGGVDAALTGAIPAPGVGDVPSQRPSAYGAVNKSMKASKRFTLYAQNTENDYREHPWGDSSTIT